MVTRTITYKGRTNLLNGTDMNTLVLLSATLFDAGDKHIDNAIRLSKTLYEYLSPFALKVAKSVVAVYENDSNTVRQLNADKDVVNFVLETTYGRRWNWVPSNLPQKEKDKEPIDRAKVVMLTKRYTKLRRKGKNNL